MPSANCNGNDALINYSVSTATIPVTLPNFTYVFSRRPDEVVTAQNCSIRHQLDVLLLQYQKIAAGGMQLLLITDQVLARAGMAVVPTMV